MNINIVKMKHSNLWKLWNMEAHFIIWTFHRFNFFFSGRKWASIEMEMAFHSNEPCGWLPDTFLTKSQELRVLWST